MSATLAGTLRSLVGLPLSTPITFTTRNAPYKRSGYVVSSGERRTSSDAAGNFTIDLEQGSYVVTWSDGAVANKGYITISSDAPVRLDVILQTEAAEIPSDALTAVYNAIAGVLAQALPRSFDTITEMLAEDDGVWNQAVTLNGYAADDGISNTWIRLPTGTLPFNSDSRLSTRGGTSLLLRLP